MTIRIEFVVYRLFHIGLAILIAGLFLILTLSTVYRSAKADILANVVQNESSEESTQFTQLANSTCGTLDGNIIDHMEEAGNWQKVWGNGAVTPVLTTVPGYNGQAIQLSYNLGTITGAWVQLRCDFAHPIALPVGAHLRFYYSATITNTLQIGLVSANNNYFSFEMKNVAPSLAWTYATWDPQGFISGNLRLTDTSQIKAIFISVIKTKDDTGGSGSLILDELQYLNMVSRTIPPTFEWITSTPNILQKAATWITNQQHTSTYLLKSWPEELLQDQNNDFAWLYDQALGLLVLIKVDLARAKNLVTTLHNLQNPDGSWYEGYRYSNTIMTPTSTSKPVGANAWLIYALMVYYLKTGGPIAYTDALEGADWLARLQRSDGSLPALPCEGGTPTEPNLDAWWAFHASGYEIQANRVRSYLLTTAWDDTVGRFKASPDSYEIFLDNQTWGAAFLHAIGRDGDALRALSYAQSTLATTSTNGVYTGFDGAGPFSVWNEGTLQYIATGGANSQYYWNQMVSQQAPDGGLPGSPDNVKSYSVWLTKWHGIAPTAWLYFAGTQGPFSLSSGPHKEATSGWSPCIYLPIVMKDAFTH